MVLIIYIYIYLIMFLTGKFIFLFCAWLKSSFITGIGWYFCMFFAARKKKVTNQRFITFYLPNKSCDKNYLMSFGLNVFVANSVIIVYSESGFNNNA